MEKIETRTALIFLHEEGIVWEDFKEDVEIDISDITENIAASLKLTNGKPHAAVLDTRNKSVTITNAAMKFGASKEVTKDRLATAHLTNSLAGELLGNFFMKFFKPKIRNRMFSDEKSALAWLQGISG